MSDMVVEASQELADGWLNHRAFVVIASERFHRVDRVPRRRDDNLGFASYDSGQDLGLDKAVDRTEMREHGFWEVLAAVAIDAGFRPVPAPG